MASRRVLFIGLDAADATLIDRWAAEGWLPNIARMRAEGALWPDMQTTAETFHVSAWPSIFTGATPDVHGLYHAYVARPGHQGVLRPRPDRTPVPFIWRLLSDHGKRCVIMDAFLTCPLRDFNGVQVVDWGSWSWFWDPTVLPASVKRTIERRFGPYPFEDHSKVGVTPIADFAGFRRRLLAAVARKTEVVKWLLESEPWDFFLVVFGESHPAGHYLWQFHDPAYLFHVSDPALQHGLRDVYVALDAAVGELTRQVGPETTVLLVSGDGMGPNYSGSHLLEELLVRIGMLTTAGATETAPARGDTSAPAVRRDLISTLRNLVPQRLRIAVSDMMLSREMRERLSLRWKTAGIAWPKTHAFVIENANEGYIRINLKGREPLGIVAPGAEYERVRDEIYRAAVSMINPRNGRKAAAVFKTDDLCRGPRRDEMPDVVILWDVDAQITNEISADPHGVVRGAGASCECPPFYTGNHAPNAFAMAAGSGVTSGAVYRGRSILDLAPTLLRLLGLVPPDHMSGAVLSELAGPARPNPSPPDAA